MYGQSIRLQSAREHKPEGQERGKEGLTSTPKRIPQVARVARPRLALDREIQLVQVRRRELERAEVLVRLVAALLVFCLEAWWPPSAHTHPPRNGME